MIRLISPILLLTLAAVASADVVSTFDADDEGWQTCNIAFGLGTATVDNFHPAGYSATGGNSGGALITDDEAPWQFFAAPSKFLGDVSSATRLSFDTFSSDNDGLAYPAVVLVSGTTALYRLGDPPGPDWTSTEILFSGSAWSLDWNPGGATVTDAQVQNVLSNLDGLYIEADWFSGNETTGLDNVRLNVAPVPEPASFAAFALAGLATLRRRRNSHTP